MKRADELMKASQSDRKFAKRQAAKQSAEAISPAHKENEFHKRFKTAKEKWPEDMPNLFSPQARAPFLYSLTFVAASHLRRTSPSFITHPDFVVR